MKKIFIFILIAGCCYINCKSIGTSSSKQDARAKKLSPGRRALIYVVRPTNVGKPFAHIVFCDGKKIGSTCGYYFVYTVVSPGYHKISCHADNAPELGIKVAAGGIYFIEQQVYPAAWKGADKLVQVSTAAGRRMLAECELSDDNVAR